MSYILPMRARIRPVCTVSVRIRLLFIYPTSVDTYIVQTFRILVTRFYILFSSYQNRPRSRTLFAFSLFFLQCRKRPRQRSPFRFSLFSLQPQKRRQQRTNVSFFIYALHSMQCTFSLFFCCRKIVRISPFVIVDASVLVAHHLPSVKTLSTLIGCSSSLRALFDLNRIGFHHVYGLSEKCARFQ